MVQVDAHLAVLCGMRIERITQPWGFEEMAEFLEQHIADFTISRQAVADHLRKAEWNVRATSRAEPMLREDLGHFDARATFGRQHRNASWRNWVDVDEKWFHTMAIRLLATTRHRK